MLRVMIGFTVRPTTRPRSLPASSPWMAWRSFSLPLECVLQELIGPSFWQHYYEPRRSSPGLYVHTKIPSYCEPRHPENELGVTDRLPVLLGGSGTYYSPLWFDDILHERQSIIDCLLAKARPPRRPRRLPPDLPPVPDRNDLNDKASGDAAAQWFMEDHQPSGPYHFEVTPVPPPPPSLKRSFSSCDPRQAWKEENSARKVSRHDLSSPGPMDWSLWAAEDHKVSWCGPPSSPGPFTVAATVEPMDWEPWSAEKSAPARVSTPPPKPKA
ncbi:hypothetical protein BC829DRAFT_486330 [Chytridium lagenaria]|nr:hypothetical protein BC829DRAFT_486330 [Chytridium lagenaria]